jgi:hypothetical protein
MSSLQAHAEIIRLRHLLRTAPELTLEEIAEIGEAISFYQALRSEPRSKHAGGLSRRCGRALREAMAATATRPADITGVAKTTLFQALRGENLRLSTLEAVADAIGCRVEFSLKTIRDAH